MAKRDCWKTVGIERENEARDYWCEDEAECHANVDSEEQGDGAVAVHARFL